MISTATLDFLREIKDNNNKLLSNLNVDALLEIISQLSLSLKKPTKEVKSVYDFAGCWESEETAEELIEMIR